MHAVGRQPDEAMALLEAVRTMPGPGRHRPLGSKRRTALSVMCHGAMSRRSLIGVHEVTALCERQIRIALKLLLGLQQAGRVGVDAGNNLWDGCKVIDQVTDACERERQSECDKLGHITLV
jgi:hypothetical protein